MASPSSSLSPAKIDKLLLWRYVFAGLCASLVSIGLARFAFTPLIPELIQTHWFSASAVVYLGAANLAGYVLGALVGRSIASRLANEHVLRLMMVLICAAFFACAFPISFIWYFGWRALSGIAGGVVMVLVAATILPHVPPTKKGVAGGAIFLGLGLGIAGSGTIIPLLLDLGLRETWLGLGIVSLFLTAASWFAWPASKLAPAINSHGAGKRHAVRFGSDVKLIYLQYALMAGAAVPTMVFLVDFLARGLGKGTHIGSVYWAMYGVGAIAGPPLYGFLADRLGPKPTIRLVTAAMTIVLIGFSLASELVTLGTLTVIIGTFAPGMVPLVLARIHEVVPNHTMRQNVAWTRASVISAAGLAISAYGFSALFEATAGDHRLLFSVAAVMLIGVLLLDFKRKSGSDSAHAASGFA